MIDTGKIYIHMTKQMFNILRNKDALTRNGIKIYHNNTFYLKHPFALKNPAVHIDWEKKSFASKHLCPSFFKATMCSVPIAFNFYALR
jgi:hypothetical protein